MKTMVLFSSLVLGGVSLLVAQGNLDPAGPPAPGMKQLAQLNPGTALSAPAILSSPGRYYLAGNINGQMTITSSNVTLDLNGFLLEPEDGGVGILAEGPGQGVLRSVTVHNGSIAGGETAVMFINVCNGTISDLSIKENTFGEPVILRATERCDGNRVERCAFTRCGGGILVSAREGGICRGNLIRSCVFFECLPGSPVSLTPSGGGICSGNQVRDCVFSGSPQHVLMRALHEGSQCEGNRVERCAAANTEGISILAVTGGEVVKGNEVVGCTLVQGLNSVGISIRGQEQNEVTGNRIDGCVITGPSQGVSIRNAAGNLLKNSLIHDLYPEGGTAPWGISCRDLAIGNRLVGNHLADGVPGIVLDNSFGTILTGNSIIDHASPFTAAASSFTMGPNVSTTGTLTNSGADAHPWANFVR